MKKEMFVSSILLLNPVMSINAESFKAATAITKDMRQDLESLKFRSSRYELGRFWNYSPDLGDQEYYKNFRYQLTFIPVSSNSYDSDVDMEYEVVVSKVDLDGNEINENDSFYYTQRIDGNTFKLFDCNSTRNCSSDYSNVVFHIFDTPKGKVLKFKRTSNMGLSIPDFSKSFFEVNE